MNKINLSIEKQESGEFLMTSPELPELKSTGLSPVEVIRNFADVLEVVEDSVAKYSHMEYLRDNKSKAFALFYNLHNIVGNEWFEVKDLLKKCSESKEDLLTKIAFLDQYGYIITGEAKSVEDRLKGGVKKYQLVADDECRVNTVNLKIKEMEDIIEMLKVTIQ
jgi:predicted RNase H-like HicB family nuclease